MEVNGYKLTNCKYEWDDGFYKSLANQVGADAQAIGERISELAEKNGSVTPKMMVDDARDENSPMHSIIFRKNDEEAAEAWREEEARKMQGAIKIVFSKEKTEIDGSTTKEIIITKAFRHISDTPRIPKNSSCFYKPNQIKSTYPRCNRLFGNVQKKV